MIASQILISLQAEIEKRLAKSNSLPGDKDSQLREELHEIYRKWLEIRLALTQIFVLECPCV